MRKLLNDANPPEDCYLVLREDLAKRLIGFCKECQFSISYKPWFEFTIVYYFRRTDFEPMARMDTVLLRFTKRKYSLIDKKEQKQYFSFVEQGFKGGKNFKHNLKKYFSYNKLARFAKKYSFSVKSKPSDLKLHQWLELFKSLDMKLL